MKVEELKYYGKSIGEIVDTTPFPVMMKIGWVIITSIIKKTRILGFIPFMNKVKQEKKRARSSELRNQSLALSRLHHHDRA